MHDFISLQSKWAHTTQQYDIESLLHQKMPILWTDTSQEGIHSAWHLLLSFGSEAICFVLQEEKGQLQLRHDIPNEAKQLWQRNIIIHVSTDELWNALYKNEAFSLMEEAVLESTPWEELNTMLQDKVLKKSLSMVDIPTGSFIMGAEHDDEEAFDNESPPHLVHIHNPFSVGKYPVTQGLYQHITKTAPSFFVGALRPVESISWMDAIQFCILLNQQQGMEAVYEADPFQDNESWCSSIVFHPERKGFALLSEAQWEYVAKAGTEFSFSGGIDIHEVAWWEENSNGCTHAIGQKRPNPWGIHDMTGNVGEWVWDSFQYYQSIATEPSHKHVVRGGSFYEFSATLRNSARSAYPPSTKSELIGFRLQYTGGSVSP